MARGLNKKDFLTKKELLAGIAEPAIQAVIITWEWGTHELDAIVSWLRWDHDLEVSCWSAFRILCYHLNYYPSNRCYMRLRQSSVKVLDNLLNAECRRLQQKHHGRQNDNAEDPSGTAVCQDATISDIDEPESSPELQAPVEDVIESHEQVEIDEKAEETFMLRQVAAIVELDLFQCMKSAVDKDDFDDCQKVAKKYGIETALGLW